MWMSVPCVIHWNFSIDREIMYICVRTCEWRIRKGSHGNFQAHAFVTYVYAMYVSSWYLLPSSKTREVLGQGS